MSAKAGMDVDPPISNPELSALKTGAKALIRAHTAQEVWQILGWEDVIAISHPDDCHKWTNYVSHLMGTISAHRMKLSDDDAGKAIGTAWHHSMHLPLISNLATHTTNRCNAI